MGSRSGLIKGKLSDEEQPYKALKDKVDCAPRFTWVLDTAWLPNPI